MNVFLTILFCLSDNYAFLISWGNEAVVVDPAEAAPVKDALEKKGLTLKAILTTHHHWDHVGGNEELVKLTGCKVYGPSDDRVPCLTNPLKDGDTVKIGPLTFEIMETPGHTSSHIVFYEPKKQWLFAGDCIFGAGCGRLFEGSPEEMHESLKKIAKLPDETKIYCGHEYTEHNLNFAKKVDPENGDIERRLESVKARRSEGKPSIPSTLTEEKMTNPFLRPDNQKIKKAVELENSSSLEVFTKIRKLRNSY